MHPNPAVISVGEVPEIQAFLEERIYEFNAKATGYFDRESFSSVLRADSGVIRAGVCGYTWGGCCYVYMQQAVVQDHPVGHANVIYAKLLRE